MGDLIGVGETQARSLQRPHEDVARERKMMNYPLFPPVWRRRDILQGGVTIMRTKYFLVSALIVLLMLPTLGFAGGRAEQPEREDGVVELTVWFGRNDFIPDDRFASFHERHPNIRVNVDVVPLEDALEQASMAASAGQAPDILQIDSRRLAPLAEAGMLRDISDVLAAWRSEDPETYNAISGTGWEHAIHKGVPHGVALSAGPFNHVYRIDWMEEAGLDIPQTWEEVLDVARALNEGENRRGYALRGPTSSVWFHSHFQAMGGQFDENGVIQLDSEAGIYALAFYQTLVREELLSEDVLAWGSGDMRAAFITGRAAQAPIGTNIFPDIQEELAYGVDWGATPPPYREGARDEWQYSSLGWPHLVMRDTNHPEEVGLVLRYLAEHDNAMSVAVRYQPTTVLSVYEDPAFIQANPWAEEFIAPFDTMVRVPSHERHEDMNDLIQDAMGEVMSDTRVDPADVAAKYQARLDALYD